jgi:hypothetical protein
MPANDKNDRDRWRELHELLGLPPDEKAAPAQPAEEDVAEEEEPVREEARFRPQSRPDEIEAKEETNERDFVSPSLHLAHGAAEARVIEEEEAVPADLEDGPQDRAAAPEMPPHLDEGFEEVLDAGEPGAEPSEGEGPPEEKRRGRRRRRRGRKGRGDRDEAAPGAEGEPRGARLSEEGEESAEEEPAEGDEPLRSGPEDEEEPRGLHRGRRPGREGRRDPESTDREREEELDEEPAADVEDEDQEKPRANDEDGDEDLKELGQFKDWNVPSWQELIASLYRPER